MKIKGKHISNWWLLIAILLLILLSPFLLMGFFAANDFAGAIFGPPAIWDRPSHTPPRADLVGAYKEAKRRTDDDSPSVSASLSLHPDGSMQVVGLIQNWPQKCILRGTGTWDEPMGDFEYDQKIDLNVQSDGLQDSCKSGSYAMLELTGRSKPYGLYWVIGDPDSGTGIWLKRSR